MFRSPAVLSAIGHAQFLPQNTPLPDARTRAANKLLGLERRRAVTGREARGRRRVRPPTSGL